MLAGWRDMPVGLQVVESLGQALKRPSGTDIGWGAWDACGALSAELQMIQTWNSWEARATVASPNAQ